MQRDLLLLVDMIDAAEQAQNLTQGIELVDLENDRQRQDALLRNFTVLGEAANQISEATKRLMPTFLGVDQLIHAIG
jgi:uncharacterized protein with HEPN domain